MTIILIGSLIVNGWLTLGIITSAEHGQQNSPFLSSKLPSHALASHIVTDNTSERGGAARGRLPEGSLWVSKFHIENAGFRFVSRDYSLNTKGVSCVELSDGEQTRLNDGLKEILHNVQTDELKRSFVNTENVNGENIRIPPDRSLYDETLDQFFELATSILDNERGQTLKLLAEASGFAEELLVDRGVSLIFHENAIDFEVAEYDGDDPPATQRERVPLKNRLDPWYFQRYGHLVPFDEVQSLEK